MIQYIVSILCILLASAYYFIYFKPAKRFKKYAKCFENSGFKVYSYPFNPFKISIIETIEKDSLKGDALKKFKEEYTKYDVLIGNALFTPVLVFLSPEARKQFIKHQIDYTYEKMPLMISLMSRILGKGLIFSKGDEWKRKRKILSSFFTYQFVTQQIAAISSISSKAFQQIQQGLKADENLSNIQFQFNLLKLTTRVFSNVILSIFLGNQSLNQKIKGVRACDFIVNLIVDNGKRTNHPLAFALGPKFLQLGLTSVDRDINNRRNQLNQWASDYIDRNISFNHEKKANNLLQLLYNSNQQINQEKYSKKELIDELKVFFLAGTDTTANFTAMMIYLTVKNPYIQAKAREQINNMPEGIQNNEDLKKLKYIQAIQKQTLRFYGPSSGNMPRVATKDHYFKQVPIEKGTSVMWMSVSTHYNTNYYENPNQFKPERWLTDRKDFDGACLTGFGMGPRGCIGQSLALTQSKIFFFEFMKRYTQIQVPNNVQLKLKFVYEAENLIIKTKRASNKQ